MCCVVYKSKILKLLMLEKFLQEKTIPFVYHTKLGFNHSAIVYGNILHQLNSPKNA